MATRCFVVAQIGTMRILINVPQANALGTYMLACPPGVAVNEFPGKPFEGKVTRTTNSLDPNSRTMLVEVQVPNGNGKLLPGMYAEVRFRDHRASPPLLVPGDSLIATNSGPAGSCVVRCRGRRGQKKIHLQAVQHWARFRGGNRDRRRVGGYGNRGGQSWG